MSEKEPLYRKWWVWAIGAVVVLAVLTNDGESASQSSSASVAESASPTVAVVVPSQPANPWGDWYTLNEANWTALTNVLLDAGNNGIDYTFNKAIEYAENITPLPDEYAQSLFDSWLQNMRDAQMAWNNGDLQSSNTYLDDAGDDMAALTDYIGVTAQS